MMYICVIRAHPHPRFGEFVQPRQKPWNVSLVGLHMLTKKAYETMRHNEVLKLTGEHPIGVREIFCRGGGGKPFAQQVAQIFTKCTVEKKRGPYDAAT